MSFLKKSIPVLMYHRLGTVDPNSSLVIPPEDFARQVEWLEKNSFRFLSLDEVIQHNCHVPLLERAVALTFDDGFHDNYEQAFPLLIRRGKTAALFVVVNWVGQNGFMGWEEIRELADSVITIGSHALTHRWLPDISNHDELHSEIFDSKKILEDRIGKEVHHFCYPVGGLNERVATLVQEAGYRAAWIASATPTVKVKNPLLSIRRAKISPSDAHLWRFGWKALALYRLA